MSVSKTRLQGVQTSDYAYETSNYKMANITNKKLKV